MPLAPGTRLGPYEVLSSIGAGGMGEVYRAHDTKLGRDVAIKVLPESFAHDAERMARFEREAQVLASLNHPHIATIHGLEESNGVRALVMELVEGPTLAERIGGLAMPLDEALPIAKQIAEGLEYAHEKGIIHRDLKPANVKLTADGNVRILDFGLARALEAPVAAGNPSISPTLTLSATQVGVILGTAAYMSPEQASGKPVDKRSDIWSFGVVLWEMLTGNRLFDGETISHTLADVLRGPIDFRQLPTETPAAIRDLLRRCLDRDLKTRLRDIGEARIQIQQYLADPASGAELPREAKARPTRFLWPACVAAALLLATAGMLAFLHFREAVPPQPEPVRFSLTVPENVTVGLTLSISPDGKQVVFPTIGGDPPNRLWIRSLDSLEARPLPGTEGASGTPFWSTDSRVLLFSANGKFKKIDVSGGPPQTLCDVPGDVVGGFWTADGKIVFSTNASALLQVPSGGGVATPVTKLDAGEPYHFLPGLLPDGRHIVYMRGGATSNSAGIVVGRLDANHQERETRRLLGDRSGAIFVPSRSPAAKPGDGYVLFVREGTLLAQPFGVDRLELSGDPVPVAEHVSSSGGNIAGNFSASANGTVVYRVGGSRNRLRWYDRQGKPVGTVGQPGDWNSLALSPDGKQLVAQNGTPSDLWLMDIARSTSMRFTFDPTPDFGPIWSPDGARIAWGSGREGTFNLYVKPVVGVGSEEALVKNSHNKTAHDWSRDGRYLIYSDTDPKTKRDLWLLPMTGDRTPQVFLQTEFNESQAKFSLDGRWVVYQSDESGRYEIYVRPFPAQASAATKFQVSTGGGGQPRWRADGKELFYVTREGQLMVVDVTTSPTFKMGLPKQLFDTHIQGGGITQGIYRWDATPDGQLFIINGTVSEENTAAPIHVILNWQAGLKK